MKKVLRPLFFVLRIVVVLLLLYYVLSPLLKNASNLRETLLTLKPLPLTLGILLLSGVILCYPFLWREILGGLGFWIDVKTAVVSWIYSNIGKYVPGKVWQFVGRTTLTKGIKPEITLFTVLLEVLISFSAAVMVFFLRFLFLRNMPILWAFYALLLLLAFLVFQHPKVLNFYLRILKKLRKENYEDEMVNLNFKKSSLLFLVYFVLWIATGFSFWLIVQGSSIKVSLLDAVTTYPISWVLGYLFLIAPAGLGVRESIIMTLLKGSYPLHVASAFSLITRLALISSDFLLFFVVLFIDEVIWKSRRS